MDLTARRGLQRGMGSRRVALMRRYTRGSQIGGQLQTDPLLSSAGGRERLVPLRSPSLALPTDTSDTFYFSSTLDPRWTFVYICEPAAAGTRAERSEENRRRGRNLLATPRRCPSQFFPPPSNPPPPPPARFGGKPVYVFFSISFFLHLLCHPTSPRTRQ